MIHGDENYCFALNISQETQDKMKDEMSRMQFEMSINIWIVSFNSLNERTHVACHYSRETRNETGAKKSEKNQKRFSFLLFTVEYVKSWNPENNSY